VDEMVLSFLDLSNETLTTATVVIAISLLLYNLTRNLRNRVARTSSVVLLCITIAYTCDVFVSLEPNTVTYSAVLRLQWIGIAFMPAAMFHLSDALLATTGLPSRGRRRRVSRLLYAISGVFLIAAAFTDILVKPVQQDGFIGMRAGPMFALYTLYFVLAGSIAFINVQRARQRCLTRDTRRRMAYLQIAMLTPVLGIFPFSALLGPGEEFSLSTLILVNASNVVVILMLLFLAYPLSFFGSRIPDRVVKTELLRFVLRGPATALLALAVIIYTAPTVRVLGLSGRSFTPFAVVTVILLWQWIVHLMLPWLSKRLIYPNEDDDQLNKLQNLSDQVLTRSDLKQLLEAILAACCDYLQVNTAFAVSLNMGQAELAAAIGPTRPTLTLLQEEADELTALLDINNEDEEIRIEVWYSYWIVPLFSKRRYEPEDIPIFLGFIGIQARSPEVNLTLEERQMFQTFAHRAAQTIDDLNLQTEIYAALEGLLPQIRTTRTRAADVEYRQSRDSRPQEDGIQPADEEREQFIEQVKAALKHYWGGPGLTHSRLLELPAVHHLLSQNDNNPVRALRAVLTAAIENQRPEGERKMLSPEWTIYNILDLRFVENLKVREVATRLALSEPDFYRKQKIAVEAVADIILKNGEN
jgi:N-terminal 7TM region of histidine kinase